MTYRVRITPGAEAAILEQARYIATEANAPINAARWLQRVYDAAETLEQWPRRCPLAEEDAFRPFEIRKYSVDGFLLLFTIIEQTQTVWIITARHGRQLPQHKAVPESPPGA